MYRMIIELKTSRDTTLNSFQLKRFDHTGIINGGWEKSQNCKTPPELPIWNPILYVFPEKSKWYLSFLRELYWLPWLALSRNLLCRLQLSQQNMHLPVNTKKDMYTVQARWIYFFEIRFLRVLFVKVISLVPGPLVTSFFLKHFRVTCVIVSLGRHFLRGLNKSQTLLDFSHSECFRYRAVQK